MTTRTTSSCCNGHRQRLRERFKAEPQAIADYEVLELLLGLVLVRRDTKPLARTLLERFGNIRAVLDARPEELEQIDGFGPALATLWILIRELMARHALSPLLEREVLADPEKVAAMARARLGNLPHEESWLALVDTQNHLISWERLRRGGISSIAIQPRDVLEQALARKASGIILVHNHPGGSPRPSCADLDITSTLRQLAPQLGLRFLDHLIITPGECYSILSNSIIRLPEVR